MLRFVLLVGVGLVLGCGASAEEVETPPAVERAELVSTLDQIAESGEFQNVLLGLTIGLEQEGLMQEAALVQQFHEMDNAAKVKRFATQLSKMVEKQLAAQAK